MPWELGAGEGRGGRLELCKGSSHINKKSKLLQHRGEKGRFTQPGGQFYRLLQRRSTWKGKGETGKGHAGKGDIGQGHK